MPSAHLNWVTTPIWVTKRKEFLHKESISHNINILLADENSSSNKYEENILKDKPKV